MDILKAIIVIIHRLLSRLLLDPGFFLFLLLLGLLAARLRATPTLLYCLLVMILFVLLRTGKRFRVSRALFLIYPALVIILAGTVFGLYQHYSLELGSAYDLNEAAAQGDIERLERILRRVEVNAPCDAQGNTLLHLAVRERDIEITRLLLEHGADPGIRNEQGKTPLDLVPRRRKDLIRLFQKPRTGIRAESGSRQGKHKAGPLTLGPLEAQIPAETSGQAATERQSQADAGGGVGRLAG